MMRTLSSRSQIEQDIKETLGLVPSFFADIPDDLLECEWELFKRFELEEPITAPPNRGTLIPVKYRQLMGIALHSETKCHYCTLFHTELAKIFGATDEEIQEAVHYAKHSLGWSAYLNGIQADFNQFSQELGVIGKYLQKQV